MNENLHGFKSISLNAVGKKFSGQWVFRNVTLDINQGEKIAVTGMNGSGKSTFLQLLAGYVTQNEGAVCWESNNGIIPVEDVHNYISFSSPYMELIEEFTIEENIDFYKRFKKFQKNISTPLLTDLAGIRNSKNKQVKNFSSGMKQRLKLVLAFMADTQILLIDEPLSNLDAEGYSWYRSLIGNLETGRTVILCSNQVKEETFFCERFVNIEDFKP